MRQLNEYQTGTRDQLIRLLSELRVKPDHMNISGVQEATLEMAADGVRIWVYPDGACLVGNGVDRVYEQWDYKDLAALRMAFLADVGMIFHSSSR